MVLVKACEVIALCLWHADTLVLLVDYADLAISCIEDRITILHL